MSEKTKKKLKVIAVILSVLISARLLAGIVADDVSSAVLTSKNIKQIPSLCTNVENLNTQMQGVQSKLGSLAAEVSRLNNNLSESQPAANTIARK